MSESQTRLIPVPDWNKYHPWPPIGGLRHLIFFAESNGFKTAFKRAGRRVLVDELEFFKCVERQNPRSSDACQPAGPAISGDACPSAGPAIRPQCPAKKTPRRR